MAVVLVARKDLHRSLEGVAMWDGSFRRRLDDSSGAYATIMGIDCVRRKISRGLLDRVGEK